MDNCDTALPVLLLLLMVRCVHGDLISQSNNSSYVQQLLRLAKSAEMRSYMRPNFDACDNFYEYSCGNWAQINPALGVPPRETNVEQLWAKAYRHKQRRLMEQPADEKADEVAVLRLKEFYASCLMFRETPEDLYRRVLLEIVAEFGGMPVLSVPGQEWQAEEFDWQETVARIKRKYGIEILNPFLFPKNHFFVGQPKKTFPETILQAMADTTADLLERHLGVESKLAKTTAKEITELEQTISGLDTDYFDTFKTTEYGILLDELDEYLDRPPHVMANYIFNELLKHFYFDWSGSVVEQCASRVSEVFPELLENMAFKHYEDAATLSEIENLWQQINQSFRGMLQNSSAEWFIPETREKILDQLNNTSLLINGYADVNFTQRYEGLQLKPKDFLHNLRTILTYQRVKAPTSVTYDPVGKRVLLPVALLQPNFFWSQFYPKAVLYGSLGTLLAQQLAHSLEDASKWDDKSLVEIARREECFKKQYGRLRLNGQYWPESDQQAENIADNLGIQVSYHAYRRFLGGMALSVRNSEALPQLNVTSRRLFFLSFSQLLCHDANLEFRNQQLKSQLQTPNALRVLGALSNFEAFGRDFNCGTGSEMTTPQKCQLFSVNLD
ncbi:endothelin-converting enzyme homolog [Drosophila takahashii]|uniref:endothelin-converting enzyme homolog n=1 Tax=Drosophila takahashii TaxID=29030 RepID=UPI0038993B69